MNRISPQWTLRSPSVLVVMCVAVGLWMATPSDGCGPYDFTLRASYDKGPEDEKAYRAGQLGVFQAKYNERLLWMAYRHLNRLSVPPEPAVQDFLTVPIDKRWLHGKSQDGARHFDAWRRARRAMEVPLEWEADDQSRTRIVIEEEYRYYEYFLNCNDDAFRHALEVCEARREQFGEDSEEWRQWLRAQDTVFANCGEGEHIPEPLDESWPEILRQDRRYQIAAARFYATDYDGAEQDFRAIAEDPTSPWQELADYLVARVLIRKGELPQAADQLRSVVESGGPYAQPASKLLDHVRFRTAPGDFLNRLGDKLASPTLDAEGLDQNLEDLSLALSRQRWQGEEKRLPWMDLSAELSSGEDLVAWIQYLRRVAHPYDSDNLWPDPLEALARFETSGQAHWWLAAAMAAHAHPKTLTDPEQFIRLRRLAPPEKAKSPADLALTYHRLRLSVDLLAADQTLADTSEDTEEETSAEDSIQQIESRLQDLLEKDSNDSKGLSRSDRNRFQHLYARLATDLNTYVQRSIHQAAAGGYEEVELFSSDDSWIESEVKDRNYLFYPAIDVLNQRPPKALLDLARQPWMPVEQARRLAVVGWVRALGSESTSMAAEAAPLVADLLSEQHPELAKGLRHLQSLPESERPFATALLVLQAPGFDAYLHHGEGFTQGLFMGPASTISWWCAGELQLEPIHATESRTPPTARPWMKEVLDPYSYDGSRYARTPMRKVEIKSAVALLAPWIFRYADSKPTDTRVPEALHRLVRATRYGCGQGHGEISKQAFRRLHRDYPSSPWTRKTPYWFD